MRVWTTTIGQRLDGAENTRTMLYCAELLRRGHEVTLWTSAYDHIRKEWRSEWLQSRGDAYRRDDGLEIRFMKGCGYGTNVSVRRFADHWLAARDFARVAPTLPRPDVIISSLPDHLTAEAAVEFGRRSGARTVVDVRDKWPDVFVDRAGPGARGAVADVVLHSEHRRAARLLRGADAVIGSMRSMLDWALEKAGRAPTWRERVFYLTTFEKNFDLPAGGAQPTGAVAEALTASVGKTVFTFVGTFNRTQHPLLILDAVDRLVSAGRLDPSRVSVVIAGDGLDAEEVRRRAAAHPFVHVVGWVDATQMSALLSRSHVGFLTMNFPSPAFNNKAFAYLASGLPIVNGATGDLADLVTEHRIGLNVAGGDADALANAIATLAGDAPLREAMTRNARRLFDERFDRDANYRAYAEHVEAVAAEERTVRRAG
jgi:glycosyltransferase involved in cell wall biosynthesis